MPTPSRIGKAEVANHHNEMPYRVLERKYGFCVDDDDAPTPLNSGNKIIHGDNLAALNRYCPNMKNKK